jgi:hypothetical protein
MAFADNKPGLGVQVVVHADEITDYECHVHSPFSGCQ